MNNRRKERSVNREEIDESEWMNEERGLEKKICKRRSEKLIENLGVRIYIKKDEWIWENGENWEEVRSWEEVRIWKEVKMKGVE